MEIFIVSLFMLGFGSLVVHEEFVPKKEITEQKLFVVDDASYKCSQVQKLGEIPKPKTIIIEKEKPCPKCKPVKVKAPCGDDRKIFPICEDKKP